MILMEQVNSVVSADTKIAFIAVVISVISLIVSALSMKQSRNLNTTNLQAAYFEDTFKEFLLTRIPNAVSKLCFEKGKLSTSYKELNNVMMDMMQSAKYYDYAKHDFYIALKNMTQNLEDKLITQSSKVVEDRGLQVAFIDDVHKDIMDIIMYINKNYHKF